MRVVQSLLVAALVVILVPAVATADSISPSAVTATIGVGDSLSINKTVTVTEGLPTAAKVDIFFLTDSTGSMGSVITAVKSAASSILSSTAALGDVAWGVGEYKDIYDSFTYRTNTNLTTSAAAAQTGINQWYATGGGDWPEADLFALETVAEGQAWRAGSTRILVWFGDAPGHDPRAGSTEATATAALNAEDIIVEAINTGNLDAYGQATRITAATGGTLFSGINAGNVVTAISSAIAAAFDEYTTVMLDLSGVPAGISASVVPGSYSGSYDRSTTRYFDFTVDFTGVTPGTYSFNVNALVDGGIVAIEGDRIVVTGDTAPIPEPSTVVLLGAALAGFAWVRRRRSAS